MNINEISLTTQVICEGKIRISRNETTTYDSIKGIPVIAFAISGRFTAAFFANRLANSLQNKENGSNKKKVYHAKVLVEITHEGKTFKGETTQRIYGDLAASFYDVPALAICRMLNSVYTQNHRDNIS